MEEGRKMFQVFAARMFEQRVLTAYREKVAQDRQKRLIEELEEEDRQRQERELKKQQDKEKKRDKKRYGSRIMAIESGTHLCMKIIVRLNCNKSRSV